MRKQDSSRRRRSQLVHGMCERGRPTDARSHVGAEGWAGAGTWIGLCSRVYTDIETARLLAVGKARHDGHFASRWTMSTTGSVHRSERKSLVLWESRCAPSEIGRARI